MTSFALFGATLAGLVRRLRLGLLLHATRSDRGTPRHTLEPDNPRANPPPPASARRSPPAGVRSGPQGRHATALKGRSSREPTCLEQIGSAMSKGNLAHHHTCPAFCPRYSSVRLDFPCCKNQPQKSELLQ